MTSAAETSEPENLVLRHLQALRREMAAIAETQALMLKKLARQDERSAELSAKLDRVESDIAHLEMKDIGRHGELLAVLRKLEHIDEDA